jgi:hypothetical protein
MAGIASSPVFRSSKMAESVWAFGMIAAPVRLTTLLFRSLGQLPTSPWLVQVPPVNL